MNQSPQPVLPTPVPGSSREHPDNDHLAHGNEERVHPHPQSRRYAQGGSGRRVVLQKSTRAGW